jgi:hypothetical protein
MVAVVMVMAATSLERTIVMYQQKDCDSSNGEGGGGDGCCMVEAIVGMRTG